MLASKSRAILETPEGLLGYESLRRVTIRPQTQLFGPQVALYELFSQTDRFSQLCVASTSEFYEENISSVADTTNLMFLIPVTLKRTINSVQIMGNFRCPIAVKYEQLSATQVINTHSRNPMHAHIFTAHLVGRKYA